MQRISKPLIKTPAEPAVKPVVQPAATTPAQSAFKPVVQPVDDPATHAPVPKPAAKRTNKPAARNHDSQIDVIYAELKKLCTLSQDDMTRVRSPLQVVKEDSECSSRQRQKSREEIRLLVGNDVWKAVKKSSSKQFPAQAAAKPAVKPVVQPAATTTAQPVFKPVV